MSSANNPLADHQHGFTLIEIMVGLAIGMLATVVILQVMSVFEAQKRVTTGTSDAQTNGSIALFNISRELGLAGYPLLPIANSPLECTTLTFGATGISSIAPVSITNGTSDTVTVRYGSTNMGGIPTAITAMGAPTANDATVDNNLGCQIGDVVIVSNGATCALTSVTAISAASATPNTVTLQNTTTATTGGNLACLGNWNEVDFAVNNNNLEREGVPIVADIVNIQAQYGVSASPSSNQVTLWVDPSGTWAAPSVTDRNRIKAIRISLVARNAKQEVANVTSALSAWTGSASSPSPTIDLSADTNWQKYRYRVFETIIPLRNVIWAKDTL